MIRHFPPDDTVGKLIDEPLTLEALIDHLYSRSEWSLVWDGMTYFACMQDGEKCSEGATPLDALAAAAKEAGII